MKKKKAFSLKKISMPDKESHKELSAVWKAQIDKQRVKERFDVADGDDYSDSKDFEDNEALEFGKRKSRKFDEEGHMDIVGEGIIATTQDREAAFNNT